MLWFWVYCDNWFIPHPILWTFLQCHDFSLIIVMLAFVLIRLKIDYRPVIFSFITWLSIFYIFLVVVDYDGLWILAVFCVSVYAGACLWWFFIGWIVFYCICVCRDGDEPLYEEVVVWREKLWRLPSVGHVAHWADSLLDFTAIIICWFLWFSPRYTLDM